MGLALGEMPLVFAGSGRDASGIGDSEVWDAVDRHGAVLFHGLGLDAQEFYEFASRFNKAFLTSPFGDRKTVGKQNELQTVTLGQAGLSLHFEFGNSPLRPDLLWLYCRTPPADGMGGETLIADGAAIFEKLAPATQKELSERRIRYRNYIPLEAFEAIFSNNSATRALVGEDPLGWLRANKDVEIVEFTQERVVFEYLAPPVRPTRGGRMQVCQNIITDAYKRPSDKDAESSFSTLITWEDGSEISPEIREELKLGGHASVRGIRWRAGDFVLVDNNRVLHGRRSTKDPQRDLLILCSFSTRFVPGL